MQRAKAGVRGRRVVHEVLVSTIVGYSGATIGKKVIAVWICNSLVLVVAYAGEIRNLPRIFVRKESSDVLTTPKGPL